MKPTKMRNYQIYRATLSTRSKQLGSTLSKDLRAKYKRKNVRIIEGDTIKIVRGEYKNVDGKVSRIFTENSCIAVEGIKKEKSKGDKFDVVIHASNVIVTALNGSDNWRISKLSGKTKKETKEAKPKVTNEPKKIKEDIRITEIKDNIIEPKIAEIPNDIPEDTPKDITNDTTEDIKVAEDTTEDIKELKGTDDKGEEK